MPLFTMKDPPKLDPQIDPVAKTLFGFVQSEMLRSSPTFRSPKALWNCPTPMRLTPSSRSMA